MVGHCLNCGKPLPRGARINRKFDCLACRVMYHRRRKDPTADERQKNPPSNGTGDVEIDAILNLPYEATLRVTLLKELLDRKKTQWQREQFEKDQQEKEVTVLDPELARRAARVLASQNFVS